MIRAALVHEKQVSGGFGQPVAPPAHKMPTGTGGQIGEAAIGIEIGGAQDHAGGIFDMRALIKLIAPRQ